MAITEIERLQILAAAVAERRAAVQVEHDRVLAELQHQATWIAGRLAECDSQARAIAEAIAAEQTKPADPPPAPAPAPTPEEQQLERVLAAAQAGCDELVRRAAGDREGLARLADEYSASDDQRRVLIGLTVRFYLLTNNSGAPADEAVATLRSQIMELAQRLAQQPAQETPAEPA